MPKNCPECNLIADERVNVCDCGYNFETGQGGKVPITLVGVLKKVVLLVAGFLGIMFALFLLDLSKGLISL